MKIRIWHKKSWFITLILAIACGFFTYSSVVHFDYYSIGIAIGTGIFAILSYLSYSRKEWHEDIKCERYEVLQ